MNLRKDHYRKEVGLKRPKRDVLVTVVDGPRSLGVPRTSEVVLRGLSRYERCCLSKSDEPGGRRYSRR